MTAGRGCSTGRSSGRSSGRAVDTDCWLAPLTGRVLASPASADSWPWLTLRGRAEVKCTCPGLVEVMWLLWRSPGVLSVLSGGFSTPFSAMNALLSCSSEVFSGVSAELAAFRCVNKDVSIYTYETWILCVCLSVTSFWNHQKCQGYDIWLYAYFGPTENMTKPNFRNFDFQGRGPPYGSVLELAIWLSTLISAIWGPRFMKIWPWAHFLVLSSMQFF